ncbi:EAL domain-containing protein [Vibrio makurazakiensis]|uniref:putative bifunctional diguanylate cyclase/phosphodiesterase n=1 Tax=Vibrio makurazakiensis TaxID=2910250 RepID=UPI003D10B3FD
MNTYEIFNHLKNPVWIYDIDSKSICWANLSSLNLWEAESLVELQNRDLSKEMTKAIEATLEDYKRRFNNRETIRTWWHFTPKRISKKALCLFSGIPLPNGRTGMLVQVLSEESKLRYDLACAEGANLSLLFDRKGSIVSTNTAFQLNFGEAFKTLADFLSCDETAAQWLLYAEKGHEILEEVACNISGETHYFDVQGNWRFDKNELLLKLTSITKQKEKLLKAKYNSEHDCLTGLYNRRGITNLLEKSVEHRSAFELMFIDLDGFKLINDTYGHSVGDQLLQQVGERLTSLVDTKCMVGRFGGDEFVVIAHTCRNPDIPLLSTSIIELMNKSFHIQGIGAISVGCSIGTAHYPDSSTDKETLLKQAGTAMHQAKSNGRNCTQAFTPDLAQTLLRKVEIRHRLAHVIEHGGLSLHYQPIIDLESKKVRRLEALLRWNDEVLGVVRPDEVVKLSEETGQIVALGSWVLNSALQQLAHWHKHYDPTLKINVNISGTQLNTTFPMQLSAMLTYYQIPPNCVALEITESAMIFKHSKVKETLSAISAIGVELYLDDFGTGYSSLSMLHDLPISTVKLDKNFVQRNHAGGEAIIKATIAICNTLRLKLVAEGVENDEQRDYLAQCGYRYLQGFLFSKPLAADLIESRYLQEHISAH